MDIKQVTAPKGVTYSDAPQRSPQWIADRVGKVGASERADWMAVSKRPNKEGIHTPLKARTDLEQKKAFEKTFNVPFSMYVTGAMQDGIDNEDFVRDEYAKATKQHVQVAGYFFDKHSVASPDGLIGDDGGLEIKWLQDSNWTKVLAENKPLDDHYVQIQDNLRMSGRTWWDYVAANPNTGRFIIIRVERDEELIAAIAESAPEVEKVEKLTQDNVHQFSTFMPDTATAETKIW